jgi:anion-transporting  ArsA/GET3 family ATPase
VPALHEVLARQLHFVCGKGGVGKSVVACALARAFHDSGHSVLLVQVNAADSHARLLASTPIGPELNEIEPRFTVVNATPAAALKEYALMTLRFEALYRTVFENRLTKAFLRFLPSLPELTMQGKIWHHAEERVNESARFERIVVDCPSTGHGLKFLRVARAIADASRVGPMADKTRLMRALVEDPRRTALHVVALPEELPVNEARDLVEQVRSQRTAPLGAVFLNQRLERMFDDDTERSLATARDIWSATGDRALAQLLDVADRRRGRERLEGEMRARLETLAMPIVELPMLLAGPPGPRDIERFAALVTDASRAVGGR